MKKKIITLSVFGFGVLGVSIGTMVLGQTQKESFRMPSVISTSDQIQVLDTQFKDRERNRSEANAIILLKNNADKEIIAFTAESGNEKHADAFSRVSLSDETGPLAKPNAEFAIEVPIGNFKTGMPLRINAVIYSDGSSVGEPEAVKELKKLVEQTLKNKGRRVDPE